MTKSEFANLYAKAGLKIFPLWWIAENGKCACGMPDCVKANQGKHPILKDGFKIASNDPAQVSAWWSRYPNANIGLACSANGLFVVDVDRHEGANDGFRSLEDFEITKGDEFGDMNEGRVFSTITQETGGGGVHMIFAVPDWMQAAPAGLGKKFPSVDFKFNGYILLEPSNHISGLTYKFEREENGDSPSFANLIDGKIPPLPRAIADFIKKSQSPDYVPQRFTFAPRDLDNEDYEQIEEALTYADFGSVSHDERVQIGMAIQSAMPDAQGNALFLDWVARGLGSKFKPHKANRQWRTFKAAGGRTVATLFKIAADYGYTNPGKRGVIVEPQDYIIMELTEKDVEPEPEESELNAMFIDSNQQAFRPCEKEYQEYCEFHGIPTGSIYVDSSINIFPETGFTPWQRSFLIRRWSARPNMSAIDYEHDLFNVPSTPANDPTLLDYDENGVVCEYDNPNYTTNIGFTAQQQFSTVGILNRKFHEMLNVPQLNGDALPPIEEQQRVMNMFGGNRTLYAAYMYHAKAMEYYNPEMSLIFAFALPSIILSGRFHVGYETTNLYMIGIGGTSTGKSHTLGLIINAIDDCKEKSRLGPKDIKSDTGFDIHLSINRACAFIIDEWGKYQKKLFGPKANTSQEGIVRALLDGFEGFKRKANVVALGASDKTKKTVDLGRVCPSLLSMTTDESMWSNLDNGIIEDGFLTRVLLVNVPDRHLQPKPKIDDLNGPEYSEIKRWHFMVKSVYQGGGMFVGETENATDTPTVTELTIDRDAEQVLSVIRQVAADYANNDEFFGKIFRRFESQVKRFALIWQLTNDPNSRRLTKRAVEISYTIVERLLINSYETAKRKIAPNENESMSRSAIEYMNKHNRAFTYRELRSKTDFQNLPHKGAFDMIVNDLCEQGRLIRIRPIVDRRKKTPRGGPSVVRYLTPEMGNILTRMVNYENWETF